MRGILLLLFLPGILLAQKKEQKQVLKIFESFQEALFLKDGFSAYQHLSKSSVDYLNQTRLKTLKYPSAQILDQDFITKILILGGRLKLSNQTLHSSAIDTFFNEAIQYNLIASELLQMSIRDILFTKNQAVAKLAIDHSMLPTNLIFDKEGDTYKIKIESIHSFLDQNLRNQLKNYDGNIDEFLADKLQEITKTLVVGQIWNPIEWIPDSEYVSLQILNTQLIEGHPFSIECNHSKIDENVSLMLSDPNFQILRGPQLHTTYDSSGSQISIQYLLLPKKAGKHALPKTKAYIHGRQLEAKNIEVSIAAPISLDSVHVRHETPVGKYLYQEGETYFNYFAKYPGIYIIEGGMSKFMRHFNADEIKDMANGLQ